MLISLCFFIKCQRIQIKKTNHLDVLFVQISLLQRIIKQYKTNHEIILTDSHNTTKPKTIDNNDQNTHTTRIITER